MGSTCAICLGSTKRLLYIPRMGSLISSEPDNFRTFTSCFIVERDYNGNKLRGLMFIPANNYETVGLFV